MPDATNDQRERAIFSAARAIEDAIQRDIYLEAACGANRELRSRVESLLVAADEAGAFLESPPIEAGFLTDTRIATESPREMVGPYKLLEQIGEGGFGIVYMADQVEPIQRSVALKIIKVGMDTKQVIARFEAERQALALMDHPNIAKVPSTRAHEYRAAVLRHGAGPGRSRHRVLRRAHSLSTEERLDHLHGDLLEPSSTPTRRGSSTATSSRATFSSPPTGTAPCPRSSTSASPRRRKEQRLTEQDRCSREFRQIHRHPGLVRRSRASGDERGLDIDTRSRHLLPGRPPLRAPHRQEAPRVATTCSDRPDSRN